MMKAWMNIKMNIKKISFLALTFALGFGGYYYFEDDSYQEVTPRAPASVIPSHYESLSACEKQDILWEKIERSTHSELPDFKEFGLKEIVKMGRQEIQLKDKHFSDIAPAKWKKYLHARGAVAKVEFVPHSSNYTGVFTGFKCGLIRLSLTYKVKGSRPVAPGLALKVLRDHTYSANISALVSLHGQERDFNFFKNPMSNIVPVGEGLGQKLVHRIFKKASNYPEELLVDDMAKIQENGAAVTMPKSPRQIFFVPATDVVSKSEEHDVRKDFLAIPKGKTLYKVFAVAKKYDTFNYENYKEEDAITFLKDAEYVGDLVTTSEFLASEFGDSELFFRHQLK